MSPFPQNACATLVLGITSTHQPSCQHLPTCCAAVALPAVLWSRATVQHAARSIIAVHTPLHSP